MKARHAIGPLALVAAVLVQFRGVLTGRVFRFEDIAGFFQPLWTAAARAIGSGHLPIWSPGAWSGQPLLADPQIGAFYPPHWLGLLLPVLRAMALMALLHTLWGGLGMYWLARLRGRSVGAATLAGLSLALGGYMMAQVRHLMFVEATAWIPWVVAAGGRWIERPSLRKWSVLAITTGLLLLTGGVSMIYFGAWFIAVLLLAQLWDAPERIPRLAGLASAALVGALLAAPALLPMIAHAPLSARALGADPHFAAEGAWPSYRYALALFRPGSDAGWWEQTGYYAGTIALPLGLWALLFGERSRRNERIALALLLGLAVGLAREGSWVFRAAYRALPLLSSTRCPARALYLFSLAVPLLAADGIDRITARLPRRSLWVAAAALLIALDLLHTHRTANPTLPLSDAEAASHLDATDFLIAHPGDRYVNDVRLDHALHNSGLVWDLENASGYSSLPIWRYVHYLWIANHGAPYPFAQLHSDLSAQGLWRFSSPLVDALNVRWVLAESAPNGPGYVQRFRGRDGIGVWENLHALPRAWLLHRVRIAKDAAAAIAAPSFDPHQEAVLEQPIATAQPQAAEPLPIVHSRSPTELRIDVTSQVAGVLVLSQPYYPGWIATLDGQPTPLLAADYALSAVALPAGAHSVELRFRSRPVELGLTTAAAALLLLLGLALRQALQRRHHRLCPLDQRRAIP